MIPLRLLIHNCTYSTIAGTDRDGNRIYNEQELQHVRFAPVTTETASAAAGETKNDRLTLYIDVANTTPAIIPQESARVTWNGEVYTIRAITPRYTMGGDTVHHYDAALV